MTPPRLSLLHRTRYSYARPVQLGPQWLRIRPLPDPRSPAPAFHLRIDPAPQTLHWLSDPLGNPVARAAFATPLDHLDIEATIEFVLHPRNPFDFVLDADAVHWPFPYHPAEAALLAPYLATPPPGPLLQALHQATATPSDTVSFLLALAEAVRSRVRYVTRMEPGTWSPERTLSEAAGSCRDSAWLLVHLLRAHGLAARFVSGHLLQFGDAEAGVTDPDAAELHAWAEAFLPGAGWIGLDATSGLLTAESHIPLAAAPHPAGAAPVQGTVAPGEAHLHASVTLTRLPAP